MAYGWGEHVGELELWVRADRAEDVFVEAARALAEVLDGAPSGAVVRREVAAASADRATLLAAWLEELVFLAETEGFVPETVGELELTHAGVSACVDGRVGAPPHLVKAVTYHRLTFEPAADGGWRAVAVLDV